MIDKRVLITGILCCIGMNLVSYYSDEWWIVDGVGLRDTNENKGIKLRHLSETKIIPGSLGFRSNHGNG